MAKYILPRYLGHILANNLKKRKYKKEEDFQKVSNNGEGNKDSDYNTKDETKAKHKRRSYDLTENKREKYKKAIQIYTKIQKLEQHISTRINCTGINKNLQCQVKNLDILGSPE